MALSDAVSRFPQAAWIDPTARVWGKVSIAKGASLWPYVVIRSESQYVRIGRYSNLQDHVMVHIGYGGPTSIGDYCSIAHRAVLHGCKIDDNCLIGIGAIVMDGAMIGENSIVAGNALVREGSIVPPNSIVMGTPAKVVRTANNWVANRLNAWLYHRNAQHYARGEHRAWDGTEYETAKAAELARLETEFRRNYATT
jgi:carbonic anhydrase/acetyltransferase-like protein (isoleucine patch superfamily)